MGGLRAFQFNANTVLANGLRDCLIKTNCILEGVAERSSRRQRSEADFYNCLHNDWKTAGTEDKSEYCVCYLLENGAWRTTGTKGAEAVRSTAGASAIFIKKTVEKAIGQCIGQ